MEWLNFHHLLYFWVVARRGSITRASAELRLAPSTVSDQLRSLEAHFGGALFHRSRGRLILTELGGTVLGYADSIFALGRELQAAVRHGSSRQPFTIGVSDTVCKLAARHFLEPALRLSATQRLIFRKGPSEQLLSDMAEHRLDLVISDAVSAQVLQSEATCSRLLGESDVALFGTAELCQSYRRKLPGALDVAGALDELPLLLPTEGTPLGRTVNEWLKRHQVRPQIVAEFDESDLLAAMGATGAGFFPASLLMAEDLGSHYGVEVLGPLHEVRERYHAVSLPPSFDHPVFLAVARLDEPGPPLQLVANQQSS